MTDKPETVADVLKWLHACAKDAKDRGHQLAPSVFTTIANRIERAMAASAVPVAWSCTQFIEDSNGIAIGTDEPRVVWGSDRPNSVDDWAPLYGRPVRVAAVPVESPPASVPDGLLAATRRLAFAARTCGGTAGHDAELCAALDAIEAILATTPEESP